MLGVLAFIEVFLPQAIAIGTEVAPLIAGIRTAFNAIGSGVGATADDFAQLDAVLKPYEDDLQARAMAAQAEIDGKPAGP